MQRPLLLACVALVAACQPSPPKRLEATSPAKVVIWRHLPLVNENIGYIAERGPTGWSIRREGPDRQMSSRSLSATEAQNLERLLRDPQVYREPVRNDPACQDGVDTAVTIDFEGRSRKIEMRCEVRGRMANVVETISTAVDKRS